MPAWLESVSPGHLGVFLLRDASPRKSGLFVRHLCRSFPALFDPPSVAALDAADAYEAGEIGPEDVRAADEALSQALAADPPTVDRYTGFIAQRISPAS